MVIEYNPLNGSMPSFNGNHSNPLQTTSAAGCHLQGPIPKRIGSFKKINYLILGDNSLSGVIPPEIAGLDSFQRLYLDSNLLEGLIPNEICQLTNLGELYFPVNKLSGIPACIGNLSRLQKLDLSSNRFSSVAPSSL
eukprot:XP_025013964.1 probably inactive leucine-rich repeat receptor-like protein kinase IMK2 [Ricinus communis]